MENSRNTYAYNYGYLSGCIEDLISLAKQPATTRIAYKKAIDRLEHAYKKTQENLTQSK